MRMIDANELKRKMYEMCNYDYVNEPCEPSDCVFCGSINETPTISQSNEPLTPCDVCRFYPPSSCDGKPCTMCPAEQRTLEGE